MEELLCNLKSLRDTYKCKHDIVEEERDIAANKCLWHKYGVSAMQAVDYQEFINELNVIINAYER